MHKRYGWIVLIAAFSLMFWLGQPSGVTDTGTTVSKPESPLPDRQKPPYPSSASPVGGAGETRALPGFLPDEAATTLELIASNGPFPHRQDGIAFQNREKRLPQKMRGYYREFTVETPGLNHRGARRIITGGDPVEIYYYTDDHYGSFREFEVQP